MSASAGFCDLRQVVQRRGTRAEARAIIDELEKTVAESLKRAEGERDAIAAEYGDVRRGYISDEAQWELNWRKQCERAAALTSRLERVRGTIEKVSKELNRLVADGYDITHEVVDGGSPEDGIPPSTRPTCDWCEEDTETCACMGYHLRKQADELKAFLADGEGEK